MPEVGFRQDGVTNKPCTFAFMLPLAVSVNQDVNSNAAERNSRPHDDDLTRNPRHGDSQR